MDVPTLLAHVRADAAVVKAAALAAPDEIVPSCPEWDRRKVVKHLCLAYGWVLAHLEAGPHVSPGAESAERWPKGGDLFAFFDRQVERVVEQLGALDPTEIWTTWVGPRPATFFARRMAHETAIHRWDVAGGEIDAPAAVDGIDELLEAGAPRITGLPDDLTGTVHLHATDGGIEGGEWLVALGPGGVTVTKEHAKGDVAVRGTASDLFLWTWNRLELDDRFEVFGDEALARRWGEVFSV